MPIPAYDDLMLPVLRRCSEKAWTMRDLIETISDDCGLSESERLELIPSGGISVIGSRVHWAKTYLKKAGLVEQPKRGHVQIAERGRLLLAERPTSLNAVMLRRYPEFAAFVLTGRKPADAGSPAVHPAAAVTAETRSATPEEQIDNAFSILDSVLADALLARVLEASPEFFERLIIKLLLAMGYGGSQENAGERLGRSGDAGIDGIVREDKLGLDQIYLQAKRYKPGNNISGDTVQAFIGALHVRGAHKGVFITTSDFTPAARNAAERSGNLRVVLIHGAQLARLMIDNGVGVRVKRTLNIKDVDPEYFEDTELE